MPPKKSTGNKTKTKGKRQQKRPRVSSSDIDWEDVVAEKDSIGGVSASDVKQSTDEDSTQTVSPQQSECKIADHLPKSTTNLLLTSNSRMADFYSSNRSAIAKDMGVCELWSAITELKGRLDLQDEEILELRSDNAELRRKIAISEGEVCRVNKELERLNDKVIELTSRSMRDNMIIKNIPEEKNENVSETIVKILTDVLQISEDDMKRISIDHAHRMGKFNTSRNRHVVVKFNTSGKSIIQRHLKNIPSDSTLKFADQIPQEIQQQRNKLWPQFIEAKNKGNSPRWNMGKLKVGSNMITASKDRITNINIDSTEAAMSLNPRHTEVRSEQDNHFQGHSVDIKNRDDVIPAIKALTADKRVAGASHVIYAYRLGDESRCISNWEDDQEWGAGRVVMNAIENNNVYNKLICVTRWSGPKHIGKRRFDLIKDAAEKAINP